MSSAQLAGLEGDGDILDNDMGASSVGGLAGEIAAFRQGWDPIDLWADEDALEVPQALVAMWIRTIRSPKTVDRSAAETAYRQGGIRGLPPSFAP